MTAPGVGAITALSVASAFDDAERFKRPSSAGAYLGLTPPRHEAGGEPEPARLKHGNKQGR
jgi:transposase